VDYEREMRQIPYWDGSFLYPMFPGILGVVYVPTDHIQQTCSWSGSEALRWRFVGGRPRAQRRYCALCDEMVPPETLVAGRSTLRIIHAWQRPPAKRIRLSGPLSFSFVLMSLCRGLPRKAFDLI
jgi:hypothetical protein